MSEPNSSNGSVGTMVCKGYIDLLSAAKIAGWAYQEGRLVPTLSIFINDVHQADLQCTLDRADAVRRTKKPAKGIDLALATNLQEGDVVRVYHAGTKILVNGQNTYRHTAFPIRPGTRQHFATQIAQFGWSIGDHTYGNPTVLEQGYAPLTIGKFTSIAPDVTIALANHSHRSATTYPFVYLADYWPSTPSDAEDHSTKGPVTIGNDVWIGTKSIILSGVTIGDGAVIAAGSVVSRDVPAYEIHGGNPAKMIKRRHSPEVANALQDIAWWDWPVEKIDKFLPLILSEDVEAFIREACHGHF